MIFWEDGVYVPIFYFRAIVGWFTDYNIFTVFKNICLQVVVFSCVLSVDTTRGQ